MAACLLVTNPVFSEVQGRFWGLKCLKGRQMRRAVEDAALIISARVHTAKDRECCKCVHVTLVLSLSRGGGGARVGSSSRKAKSVQWRRRMRWGAATRTPVSFS